MRIAHLKKKKKKTALGLKVEIENYLLVMCYQGTWGEQMGDKQNWRKILFPIPSTTSIERQNRPCKTSYSSAPWGEKSFGFLHSQPYSLCRYPKLMWECEDRLTGELRSSFSGSALSSAQQIGLVPSSPRLLPQSACQSPGPFDRQLENLFWLTARWRNLRVQCSVEWAVGQGRALGSLISSL